MATITCSNGIVLVDDEDIEMLKPFSWHIEHGRYACYNINLGNGKYKKIHMHRAILGLSSDDAREVDHINHNGLDNRRANLRLCNHSENARNARRTDKQSSIYKGVSFHKATGKWTARITVDYEVINIGLFKTEIEAAIAYDTVARNIHGEFACLNFS